MVYLAHTPEVPPRLHAGAIASANRRYTNYRQAVRDILAEGDLNGTSGDADQAGDEE